MNSKDWQKGFNDPLALGAADVAWLEQAVASFPYAAALHALYAKALKNENHYLAPQALRRAAVVSPSRRSLMAWMEGVDFSEKGDQGFPVSEPLGAGLASVFATEPAAPTTVFGEVPVSVPDVPTSASAPTVSAGAPVSAPNVPVAASVSSSSVAPAPSSTVPGDPVDLSHLPDKVRDAILRSRNIAQKLHAQQHLNPAPVSPPASLAPRKEGSELDGRVEALPVQEGREKELVPERPQTLEAMPKREAVSQMNEIGSGGSNEPAPVVHSPFAQWLAQQAARADSLRGASDVLASAESGNKETNDSTGKPGREEVVSVENAPTDSPWTAPVVLSALEPLAVVPKPVANALIDKFLEREGPLRPGATQRRAGDVSEPQVDLSASSLGGDPVFMTETLAQLYLQQGAFDKAVQAYEILRLKYPEKSAIFAAQILEIRLTQRTKKP